MKRKRSETFPGDNPPNPIANEEIALIRESHSTTCQDGNETKPDRLCLKCKALDFKSIFTPRSDPLPPDGLPVTDFRSDSDADCSFCSMVISVLPVTPDGNPRISNGASGTSFGYHLRACDSLQPLRLCREPHRLASQPNIVLAVVPGRPDQDSQADVVYEAIGRGLIVPTYEPSPQNHLTRGRYDYRGRIVRPDRIDFTLLRSWIDNCRKWEQGSHQKCSHHYLGKARVVTRVIDCFTRKMVPLIEDMEYLALSYVWGPQKVTDTTLWPRGGRSDFLPSPNPKTIEDAITAVRRLGKQYLWVDRYCIWDSEDRHLQIQNMHRIYINAICTIVAAHGDDADSGLCGISSSRCTQPQLRTNAGILVTTFPHLAHQLARSRWASRGWTYQEAVLSRRCLFFTSDQVYFVCQTSLHCEAVVQSSLYLPDETQQALGPGIMNGAQPSCGLDGYADHIIYRHIREYSGRSLTFDSDALNAFRGIISAVSTSAYYGLPFLESQAADSAHHDWPFSETQTADSVFANALLWRSTGHSPSGRRTRRREGYPTWTWTSLLGQIDYSLAFSPLGRGPSFFVENPDQTFVSIKDLLQDAQAGTEKSIPERSRYLRIKGYVVKVRLQRVPESRQIIAYPVNKTLIYVPISGHHAAGLALDPPGQVFLDLPDDESLCSRFDKEDWDAVQLQQEQSPQYWMLLDSTGSSTSRRIGLIKFNCHIPNEDNNRLRPQIEEARMIRIE
jgi:Heterokaryon incompatibility protein (HET)